MSDIVGFVNSDYFYRVNLSPFPRDFLLPVLFAGLILPTNGWRV